MSRCFIWAKSPVSKDGFQKKQRWNLRLFMQKHHYFVLFRGSAGPRKRHLNKCMWCLIQFKMQRHFLGDDMMRMSWSQRKSQNLHASRPLTILHLLLCVLLKEDGIDGFGEFGRGESLNREAPPPHLFTSSTRCFSTDFQQWLRILRTWHQTLELWPRVKVTTLKAKRRRRRYPSVFIESYIFWGQMSPQSKKDINILIAKSWALSKANTNCQTCVSTKLNMVPPSA